MQVNSSRAMSLHAKAVKALIKPKEVKPKIPKGSSHKLSQLAYIAHPKLGKRACASIAKDLRLCHPESKDKQGSDQALAAAAAQALAQAGSQSTQAPTNAPQ